MQSACMHVCMHAVACHLLRWRAACHLSILQQMAILQLFCAVPGCKLHLVASGSGLRLERPEHSTRIYWLSSADDIQLALCPQCRAGPVNLLSATAAAEIKYLSTMNRVLLKASEIFLSAFLPLLDDSSRQRCWDELQACAVQYLQYGLGNDSRGTQWRDHLDREAVRVSLQQVIVFLSSSLQGRQTLVDELAFLHTLDWPRVCLATAYVHTLSKLPPSTDEISKQVARSDYRINHWMRAYQKRINLDDLAAADGFMPQPGSGQQLTAANVAFRWGTPEDLSSHIPQQLAKAR